MTRIGLGMAALGRPGYINLDRSLIFGTNHEERTIERMQSQTNDVINKLFQLCSGAQEQEQEQEQQDDDDEQQQQQQQQKMIIQQQQQKTIPWFDCARSYGLSEKFVGEYLRNNNISPDSVYVSSKWGYTYVADYKVTLDTAAGSQQQHEIKDHSIENFLKQIQETEEYIGEYINLYQIHSATFDSGILTDQRTHEALANCRIERNWKIGLSVSSTKQSDIIREAMKIRVKKDNGSSSSSTDDDDDRLIPLFDSVQCTYNIFEQKPAIALQEAANAGLDIIIKEGLANGRALRCESLIQYSKSLSCEPDQLALACIIAQPFKPRVLSGAITPEQLESNWKAIDIAKKLEDNTSLLDEIMAACIMDSEEYWSERSALAWN